MFLAKTRRCPLPVLIAHNPSYSMRAMSSLLPTRFARLAAIALTLLFTGSANAQLQKVVTLVKGEVTNAEGQAASDVSVAIYKGTEKIFTTKSNKEGKFNATIAPNATYRVTFNNSNYQFAEQQLVVPAMDKFQETPLRMTLKTLKNGEPFLITTQIFKPKSSMIEAEGATRLEDIVTTVKQNPKLTLDITVYPDATIKNSKKQSADETLLASRASAVKSLLMSRGLAEKQFNVIQEKTTPSDAKFEVEIVEVKKKKETRKKVKVPQYIRVVGRVG